MTRFEKKIIGTVGFGIITMMLITGCSSKVESDTQPSQTSSQEMMGEVKAEAFGDGKITPGNSAEGILPTRSDGTPRYLDVSIEYPQGIAFVQGFRGIFPNLDEAEYRKGARYPLRNAQEVCGGIQLDLHSPEQLARDVQKRIELQIDQTVTETQANSVYNLAIDTVCPAYIAKKIP